MELLKKLAAALRLSKENPTESDILTAISALKPEPPQKKDDKQDVKLSNEPAAQVIKLVAENREIKLSGLVKSGLISPAVKDLITARYVKDEAVKLELSKGNDDGFDFLYTVLSQNTQVKLDELTGAQVIELSNKSASPDNPMKKAVNKQRTEAGLKEV